MIQKTRYWLGLALISTLTLLISACSSTIELPALSQSQEKHGGQVIWRDLVTSNPERVKAFYKNVFGWEYQEVNDDYSLIKYKDTMIGGIAKLPKNKASSYWLPVISSKNLNKSLLAAEAAGGKILIGKTNLVGRGDIAVIQDPQGAVFSLLDTVSGDPKPLEKINGSWMWQEVWSDSIENSQNFYQSIAIYKSEKYTSTETDPNGYHYLSINGKPAFGLVKKPNDDVASLWANYIKVADVEETLAKVTQFGGDVLMTPRADVRNGSVAIVRDPSSAGFVIQEIK